MGGVLIIDDRPGVRGKLAHPLRCAGFDVRESDTVEDAFALLRSSHWDIVLAGLDVSHSSSGEHILRELVTEASAAPVIVFTSAASVRGAVATIKAGGSDYWPLPIDPDEVVRMTRTSIENGAVRDARVAERRQAAGRGSREHTIIADIKTKKLFETVQRTAEADCTVLITGESGTGKEVVAWNIFKRSQRRDQHFVAVNCGAIPDTLAESEFFGHHKGAFTGATADKAGLVEEANGGVLFLDEIGEMSPRLQVMLLRFLDSAELRRVGATTVRHVNARIIAATNRSLAQRVREGVFRPDLFYRLSVMSLYVPPLRERRGDIPALAEDFLRRTAARQQKDVRAFSPDALALLCHYSWPGNVRELYNCIERALVLARHRIVTPADLPAAIRNQQLSTAAVCAVASESHDVVSMVERFGGNQTRAAAALGVSRTTLWRKLRQSRRAPSLFAPLKVATLDGEHQEAEPARASAPRSKQAAACVEHYDEVD